MSHVVAIGTYLPPWEKGGRRVAGPDEDALTMAVAAGRAADPTSSATRVVLVTRNFTVLEGGIGGILLAALSLSSDTPVTEVLGGAPTVLEQIADGAPGTLVIAVDHSDAAIGAGAALIGNAGLRVETAGRQNRSLPVVVRRDDGSRRAYNDPRLLREIGVKESLSRIAAGDRFPVIAVAGGTAAQLGSAVDAREAVAESAAAATSAIRCLAQVAENATSGMMVAVEQATVVLAEVASGQVRVARDETQPNPIPRIHTAPGGGIPVSLASYARAFDPKLRWEAAAFDGDAPDTAPLFPPRQRVDEHGNLMSYQMVALPRTGVIYTQAEVVIPVPDLPSPYTLAVVALDDSPVRVLLKVTGIPVGQSAIGDRGSVVFRRIAVRTGIPDYGYMFWPGKHAVSVKEGVAA